MTAIPKDILIILSPTEAEELRTRVNVAALLEKKATYREIQKQTNVGAATIARIVKNMRTPEVEKMRGEVKKVSKIHTTKFNPHKYSFGFIVGAQPAEPATDHK
ncbi:MAG: Trp family transcriptional regulator [candidate division WWE3 bacterium]|nr:Trp family transcriptional regulator [candidate division WWE3 bacterium]